MPSADLLGEGELGVIKINGDDVGALTSGAGDDTEAYGAAADDGDDVLGGDAAAHGGMKAHGERFDETKFAKGE